MKRESEWEWKSLVQTLKVLYFYIFFTKKNYQHRMNFLTIFLCLMISRGCFFRDDKQNYLNKDIYGFFECVNTFSCKPLKMTLNSRIKLFKVFITFLFFSIRFIRILYRILSFNSEYGKKEHEKTKSLKD